MAALSDHTDIPDRYNDCDDGEHRDGFGLGSHSDLPAFPIPVVVAMTTEF